jgi:hypothetical protein
MLPQLLSGSAGLFGCSALEDDDELRRIDFVGAGKQGRGALAEPRDVGDGSLSVDGAGDVAQVAAVSLSRCLRED